MARRRLTPAQRVRDRRDPAIFAPPPLVKGERADAVAKLALVVGGQVYPIADNVEGDTPWSMGMDQAGNVTVPVRDPSGSLVLVLQDEAQLQQDGVRCTIQGTNYMVVGVSHDEGLYTLTLEDEVSWRLRQFSTFKAQSRSAVTRFGFIQGLVDEASRRPLARMRSFIPEIDDKQPITPSRKKT